MTISSYKVETVLRAYNKQIKSERPISEKTGDSDRYKDVVTLSATDNKEKVYEKISYSLLDVILKNDQTR